MKTIVIVCVTILWWRFKSLLDDASIWLTSMLGSFDFLVPFELYFSCLFVSLVILQYVKYFRYIRRFLILFKSSVLQHSIWALDYFCDLQFQWEFRIIFRALSVLFGSASFSWWLWSSGNPASAAWMLVPMGLTAYQAWAALGHWVEDPDLLGSPSRWSPCRPGVGAESPLDSANAGPGCLGSSGSQAGLYWLPLTPCDGGRGREEACFVTAARVGIRLLLGWPFPDPWLERAGLSWFCCVLVFWISSWFSVGVFFNTHSRRQHPGMFLPCPSSSLEASASLSSPSLQDFLMIYSKGTHSI